MSKKEKVSDTASMQDEWAVGALKPKNVENQSPEALSKLAKDIATNLVFTDAHIRGWPQVDPTIIKMIFMVLALGAFSDSTKEYVNDIGMIYEYYDKAGPRSVNGYPIFFSCGILSKHDAKIVWEKVEKVRAALEAV